MNSENKFFLIFKKEALNVIRDKKSVITFIFFSTFFTPLLITGIGALSNLQKTELNKETLIIAINNKSQDQGLENTLRNSSDLTVIQSSNYQKDLTNQKLLGYIEITQQDGQIKARYIYDQTSNLSINSVIKVQEITQNYIQQKRAELLKSYNLSEEKLSPIIFEQKTLQEIQNKPQENTFLASFLPYFIMIGLIQGASQFAIELTAGEKERNTLATTLSMNASRTTIGLAKVSVILIISLISLILNVTGVLIGFLLAGNTFGSSSGSQSTSSLAGINLTGSSLFQLFIVLLPLSFVISSLLILIGTYARSQKEAGIYVLPLMISAIFIGFTGSAFDANTPAYVFAIPLVGHVALIKQILLNSFVPLNAIISIIVSFILFFIVLSICINLFSREEIIFRK